MTRCLSPRAGIGNTRAVNSLPAPFSRSAGSCRRCEEARVAGRAAIFIDDLGLAPTWPLFSIANRGDGGARGQRDLGLALADAILGALR